MNDSKPEGLRGVARLIAAVHHSIAGLGDAWRREAAFRQEVLLLIAAVPLSVWVGDSIGQVGLLLGSILFLMIVELVNSAIETVGDRIGPERHELSRVAVSHRAKRPHRSAATTWSRPGIVRAVGTGGGPGSRRDAGGCSGARGGSPREVA